MGRIESVGPAQLRKAEWQVTIPRRVLQSVQERIQPGNGEGWRLGEGLFHGCDFNTSGNQALALHILKSLKSLKSFLSPFFTHFTYLESRGARPRFPLGSSTLGNLAVSTRCHGQDPLAFGDAIAQKVRMNHQRLCLAVIVFTLAVQLQTVWADAPATNSGPVGSENGFIFLSTRGFARTCSDANNKGVEASTLHRQEFPYGAAPGWKWVYQGYSDGTKDTINIKGAGVWIQQAPGEALVRLPLTFNGGASHVIIPKEALQETDPISTEIKPGAVVWATIWYCAGDKGTGLPFQNVLCIRESKPGLEDQDGTAVGPLGSLPDYTLKGGFHHDGVALTAGVPYCARGFQPMGAVGRPSPSYHGPEIVPFFIGDSINIQYIDVFDDKTVYSMRGYNGRFCASKYPYMIYGQGGGGTDGFLWSIPSPLFVYIVGDNGAHKRKVTHLFNEYGINEIRLHNPPSEIATFEWSVRQKVASVARTYGLPYIQSTLMPCEAGPTLWHTASDADKANFATFVAQRQAFNNLVRTQSDDAHLPGCVGFWDPCTVVETDWKAGSNKWVAAYRTDGIHPNSAGHAAVAGTISPELVENHPNPVPVQ